MKIITLILLLSVSGVLAQTQKKSAAGAPMSGYEGIGNFGGRVGAPDASQPVLTPQQQMAQAMELAREYFKPAFPWRMVDGKSQHVNTGTWVQFVGVVDRVTRGPDNAPIIFVRGYFGQALTPPPSTGYLGNDHDSLGYIPEGNYFAVRNSQAAPGTVIYWETGAMAFPDGQIQTFNSVGTPITCTLLDFGVPCAPPPPPAAELEREKKKKAETDAKLLAWEKQKAADNDPYGLFKMGQRTLSGDGVTEDPDAGRALLVRASALGSLEASNLLATLDRPPTNSIAGP